MSLLAWYPLTHDCKNYGALGSILNPTLSPSQTFVDGKIGQALYRGSLSLSAEQMKQWIGNTISIAMWVYTKNDGTYSAGNPFFGHGGMTKPNNRKFTMFHYPSINDFHCSWQNDIGKKADGSGNTDQEVYWSCAAKGFFPFNTWVHLCVVQDGENETITVYRNGAEYSTSKVPGLKTTPITQACEAPLRSDIDYQLTNDIRIYDHALSPLEVKEISKGLMYHYSFNDVGTESATNLITGIQAGNLTSHSNGVITVTRNNDDTWFKLNLSEKLVAGQTYTLSCQGELPEGKVYTFGINHQDYKRPHISIKNGFNSYTFVADEDSKNQYITMDDILDYTTRTAGVKFSHFMLTKTDHPVGYSSNSRSRTIYKDESGNGHDATEVDLTYTIDSQHGKIAAQFNGTTSCLKAPWVKSDLFSSDYTINFWVKHNPEDVRAVYLGDHELENSLTVLNLERYSNGKVRYYYNSAKPDYIVSNDNASIAVDKWYMITYTCNKATKTIAIYVNGEKVGDYTFGVSDAFDLNVTTKKSFFYIGRDHRNNSQKTGFQGLMSDFRMYATTFTDDDVALLYHNPCSFDEKESIFTGEFLEGEDEINIARNSVLTCDEVCETPAFGYELLEYIENNASKQYINTNWYWHSESARIIMDATLINNTSASSLFGNEECLNGTASGDRHFGIIPYGSNGVHGYYVGSGLPLINDVSTCTIGQRFKLDCSTTSNKVFTLKINDALIATQSYGGSIQTVKTSSGTDASKGLIYIFANHNSTQSGSNPIQNVNQMRLHSFKMYDNDALVRHFVPVRRKSDNTVGLYDIVYKQFYSNAGGSTNFIAGPVIATTDIAFFKDGRVSGYSINEI